MTFSHPLLLLTLLVVPLAIALYKLAARRRMRYAVRYTNVDVLALVVAARAGHGADTSQRACSWLRSQHCAWRCRDHTSRRR